MLLVKSLRPIPSAPPLEFTQGDAVTLTLFAQDNYGNPVDVSTATFSTQINGPNGAGPVTFGNTQHTVVSGPSGQFSLTLASTDTPMCGLGFNKDIITQITIGGKPQYFQGVGILTVSSAQPMP